MSEDTDQVADQGEDEQSTPSPQVDESTQEEAGRRQKEGSSDSEGIFFWVVLGVVATYVMIFIPTSSVAGSFGGGMIPLFVIGLAVLAAGLILFRAYRLRGVEVELSLTGSLLSLAVGVVLMLLLGLVLNTLSSHLFFVKYRPEGIVLLAAFVAGAFGLVLLTAFWIYSLAARRWSLLGALVGSGVVGVALGLAMAFPIGFAQCQASIVLNC